MHIWNFWHCLVTKVYYAALSAHLIHIKTHLHNKKATHSSRLAAAAAAGAGWGG
jgi:hypothetical protein